MEEVDVRAEVAVIGARAARTRFNIMLNDAMGGRAFVLSRHGQPLLFGAPVGRYSTWPGGPAAWAEYSKAGKLLEVTVDELRREVGFREVFDRALGGSATLVKRFGDPVVLLMPYNDAVARGMLADSTLVTDNAA